MTTTPSPTPSPTGAEPTTAEILGQLSTPLPGDARSLSRRRFLQSAVATSGAFALGPGLLAGTAGAAAPLGPADGILVLVTMAGGNDGLNTVIPVADGAYHSRRGRLAVPASRALPLTDERALHPNLGAVHSLWEQGMVAVIEGVGAPGTDLSHFSSMARWMAGTATTSPHSGWLGRFIDGLPGGDDPFHGVSIGTSVPLVMQGLQRRASGLPATNNGIYEVNAVDGVQRRQLDAISYFASAPTGRGELADALANAGHDATGVAGLVEPVYAQELPDGDIKRQLDLCARLINANLGIRVLSVIYGDFDSHADQAPMHEARLADFNEGIKAFYNKLHPSFSARTLILTVSEFGRRLQANHSDGTDHGAASTLMAIGAQVRGGFYGELPSLTQLDNQGNLRPSVDYRSVYATVLDGWLNADASQILGGHYEDLGFVAPPAPSRTTSGINPATASRIFTYRAQVIRLYLAYFGRVPDSGGLEHWVRARRSGATLSAVSDAFASSAEFRARAGHLSNQQYVELLYQEVLGRSADGAGLAHWVSLLDQGMPRGQVMVGFSEAPEFAAATAPEIDRVEANGPVARLYLAYFLRGADTEGLRYWIGTGMPVDAVSDAFAASPEFVGRYGNLDDSAFVDLVYTNVLGRPADAAGRQYWIGQLARGATRGQLMTGFSESTEFITGTGTLA